MIRIRRPGFVTDIGFARKKGRGSRGINVEALDMAMVATIHALYAFYSLPNLDVFVRDAGDGMMRRFSFQWWEK